VVTVTSSRSSREWTGIFRTECKEGSSPEAILFFLDDHFTPQKMTSDLKGFKQHEIKDLIGARSLSKGKAERLASRFKERNLVLRAVKVCYYRIRNNALKIFFRLGGLVVFCHDIDGLINGLKQEHNSSDWRLFIGFSQKSLKAVFSP
jgi:hypothetical protein